MFHVFSTAFLFFPATGCITACVQCFLVHYIKKDEGKKKQILTSSCSSSLSFFFSPSVIPPSCAVFALSRSFVVPYPCHVFAFKQVCNHSAKLAARQKQIGSRAGFNHIDPSSLFKSLSFFLLFPLVFETPQCTKIPSMRHILLS